jgi:hypothetical protein
MTIAAGFVCREGVVLCADTEHTGWSAKFHDSKLGDFEIPGGKIAFALAGNTSFAWAVMEKCKRLLQTIPHEKTLTELERILDREYRRNVLSNPGRDQSYHYWLLIAIWSPGKRVALYVTNETAIREVTTFDCIGIGRELADYLIRPCFMSLMPERLVLPLAAYALAAVKNSITGCGGMSVYFVVRQDDGQTGLVSSSHPGICEQLDSFSKVYDVMTTELLLQMSDPLKGDADFAEVLRDNFSARLIAVRRGWTAQREKRILEIASHNPHLSASQVRQAFDQLSMGIVPLPQPLPESPGGSDES